MCTSVLLHQTKNVSLLLYRRYFLIVSTFKVHKTMRHERLIVSSLLLFVSITSIPYIQGVRIETDSQRCVNIVGESGWFAHIYTWFSLIVYSLLPIAITSVLAVKLQVHFSKEASSSLVTNRKDLHKRIMRHMMLIFLLFIVCTLPSRLVSIIMHMVNFRSRDVLLGFQFLSYILYSLQGTLNPILYSMLAREWRKNLSRAVRSTFRNSVGGRISVNIANHIRLNIVNNFRITVGGNLQSTSSDAEI